MKLTVLGTGTALFSLKRFPAGYLIHASGKIVLLDSGSGTIRRCLQAGVHPNDIDIIAYTHLHPDHTGELAPLLFGYRSESLPRQKELAILAPPAFQDFWEKLTDLYRGWLAPSYPLQTYFTREPITLQGLGFKPYPVEHMEDSVAYRIEAEGKSFCFSGDSGYCEGLVKAMRGVDLGVCECSFPEKLNISTHMSPEKCRRLFLEARPKKLVLSHFYPEVEKEDILSIVDPEGEHDVVLAEDLLELTF